MKTKKRGRRPPVCIVPDCTNEAVLRGVCWTCYHAARRKIKAGAVTDDRLVKAGLLLPSRQGERPSKLDLAMAEYGL